MNQELLQSLLVLAIFLAIVSCGLSIMLSPLTGKKVDAFLILRPITRYGKRLLQRSLTGLAKALKQWAKKTWLAAKRPHRTLPAKTVCYVLATIFALSAFVLAIPADIIGSGKKK